MADPNTKPIYRILQFYTLTKFHKPLITGRPITSECGGPAEKNIICLYIASTYIEVADFIKFIEKTRVKNI